MLLHSFHLLRVCGVPDPVMGARNTVMNETQKIPAHRNSQSGGKTHGKKINKCEIMAGGNRIMKNKRGFKS